MGSQIAFLSGAPGPFELLVLFVIILVLFGPRRLPEAARMLGRALHEMRRASDEFRNQVMNIDTVEPRDGTLPKTTDDTDDDGDDDDAVELTDDAEARDEQG